MTTTHQVFVRNAGGIDAHTFIELTMQPVKRLLGDLFGQWPKVGFDGGESQYQEAMVRGASAEPSECRVASGLSVSEAELLVSSLNSILWENAASSRPSAPSKPLPPAGGNREYAVTIVSQEGNAIDEQIDSLVNTASGNGDAAGGHAEDYTYPERGFSGGRTQFSRTRAATRRLTPPLLVVACEQTLREAQLLSQRISDSDLLPSTASVVVHGAADSFEPIDPIRALVVAHASSDTGSSADGTPLPGAGGDRLFAVSVQGVHGLDSGRLRHELQEAAGGSDAAGGHPDNYQYQERGFGPAARLKFEAMRQEGLSQSPPIVVVAREQTLREARVLESRLSAANLGSNSRIVVHTTSDPTHLSWSDAFASMDVVDALWENSSIEDPAAGLHGLLQTLGMGPSSNGSKDALAKLPRFTVDDAKLEQLQRDGKNVCSLCLEEVSLGDTVTELECSHCFHASDPEHEGAAHNSGCRGIDKWLEHKNSCPVCRHQLPRDQNNSSSSSSHAGMEERERRSRGALHRLFGRNHTEPSTTTACPTEGELEDLVGRGSVRFSSRVAEHVCDSQASDEKCAQIDSEIREYVSRGWELCNAISMMRVMAVRDLSLLTADIDRRSARFVTFIHNAVVAQEAAAEQAASAEPENTTVAALPEDAPQLSSSLALRFDAPAFVMPSLQPAEAIGGTSESEQLAALKAELQQHRAERAGVEAALQEHGEQQEALEEEAAKQLENGVGERGTAESPQENSSESSSSDDDATERLDQLAREHLTELQQEAGDQYKGAVKIVYTLVKNLMKHADVAKYRTIDLQNQKLQQKCTKFVCAQQLLRLAGFEPVKEGGNSFHASVVNEYTLERLSYVLNEELCWTA